MTHPYRNGAKWIPHTFEDGTVGQVKKAHGRIIAIKDRHMPEILVPATPTATGFDIGPYPENVGEVEYVHKKLVEEGGRTYARVGVPAASPQPPQPPALSEPPVTRLTPRE